MKRCAQCNRLHGDEVAACECGLDLRLVLPERLTKNTFSPGCGVLGAFLAFLAFILFDKLVSSALADGSWGAAHIITIVVISLGSFLVHQRLHRRALSLRDEKSREGQRARDRRALGIKTAALEGGFLPEFSLYLRAFEVTAGLAVPYWTTLKQRKDQDLESLLAEALEPSVPLIGLGPTDDHLGAGRLASTESDWQLTVTRLMEAAVWILVIPSHREGTRWEVERILTTGLTKKTVFLMPARTRKTRYDVEAGWTKARESLAKLGTRLPDYTPKGAVFRIDEKGDWHSLQKLPWNLTAGRMRGVLKKVMSAEGDEEQRLLY